MIPKQCQALQLDRANQKGERNLAIVRKVEIPKEEDGMILIKMKAAGFNRRDEWAMQNMYPGLQFGNSTIGCDGVGIIVRGKMKEDKLVKSHPDKLVILSPTRGWLKDISGPEAAIIGTNESKQVNKLGGKGFGLLGCTKPTNGVGTFIEYCQVEDDMVVNVPSHLNAIQAAALPCGGVTAFRALFTKANLQQGQSILITGIGGGVALLALQMAIAKGANVFVTGGSEEKIKKAIELGAKGGVLYRQEDWPKQLKKIIEKECSKRPFLDCVIDSAGGQIAFQSTIAGLKVGGKVVCFGMTASPKINFTMREVLSNMDLMGSTMGSFEEFKKMIQFIDQYKIVPVIDSVLNGLNQAEKGFELLGNAEKRSGGKVIVNFDESDENEKRESKL